MIAQVGFKKSDHDRFDLMRTARASAYGLLFSFIGDKWYKILAKVKFPGKPLQSLQLNKSRDTVTRVAVDQLGWAPVGIPLYYYVMTLLEGKGMNEAKEKVDTNWWPTLTTNWTVWPLFQALNFSLVPVQHRLLMVNIVSIAWNCFLSLRNAAARDSHLPTHMPPVPE